MDRTCVRCFDSWFVPALTHRIHYCGALPSNGYASVVVLHLWTLPLEMSLGFALKASSFLTCLSASLVVSSIGIYRTSTVTGQMANSVVLVAFGRTLSIMVIVVFSAQRFRSSVRFLLTRPSSVSPTSVLSLALLLLVLIVP
ncbi:hypothetical protein Tco_0364029 [Tanacetum coccineum]